MDELIAWPVGAQYADLTGTGTLDGIAADLMEASTHSMHLSELYKKDMIPKGVSISSQILTFLKKHPSSTSFLIKQKILPSGVDYQTENLVSKALTRLKAAGEIRTTGEKRRYRYSLTNITVHKLES
jgi:hypothetical protein